MSDDDQFLFIGDDIAIAQTEYGKVQGYLLYASPKTRAVDRCETCGFLWEYGAATYGEPVAQ